MSDLLVRIVRVHICSKNLFLKCQTLYNRAEYGRVNCSFWLRIREKTRLLEEPHAESSELNLSAFFFLFTAILFELYYARAHLIYSLDIMNVLCLQCVATFRWWRKSLPIEFAEKTKIISIDASRDNQNWSVRQTKNSDENNIVRTGWKTLRILTTKIRRFRRSSDLHA